MKNENNSPQTKSNISSNNHAVDKVYESARTRNKTEDTRKGCGKITEWSNRKYLCGEIEDLKHSDHIVLCPECEKTRSERE